MDIAQQTYVPSKTRRPEVLASAIERVGLNDRLDAVLDHPITLVTAPAGFGKSWAVAGWLQGDARPPSCWVTVDSYDDDAMRLWTHLIGAVRDAGLSAAAAEAAGLITGSPAGWPRIVDALAAGLAEGAEPLVIVLDDIHAVTDPEALASLGQFLAQLPAATHSVFVGRRDPDIPLARWRVAGELLDREPIERHVALERRDDPVAIAPSELADLVVFEPVRFGEPRQVEPMLRPAFAVTRRGQQPINEALVSVRSRVGDEPIDLVRRWWQAAQIE